MREKYESLSLAVLKELAKARGMKGISTLKKSALIEAMLAQDDREQQAEKKEEPAEEGSSLNKKEAQEPQGQQEAPAAGAGRSERANGRTRRQEASAGRSGRAESANTRQSRTGELNMRPGRAEESNAGPGSQEESNLSPGIQEELNVRTGRPEETNVRTGRTEEAQGRPARRDNSSVAENGSVRRERPDHSARRYERSENASGMLRSGTVRRDSSGAESGDTRRERPDYGAARRENRGAEGSDARRERMDYGAARRDNSGAEGSDARREQPDYSAARRDSSGAESGDARRERTDYGAARRDNSGAESGDTRSTFTDADRPPAELSQLDSGCTASGILEVMPDGYGFIRSDNYLPGENDVYVSPSQIRKFNLKTGDIISGNTRIKSQQEKFSALLYLKTINGKNPSEAARRYNFEDMTPIFPNERLRMERGSRAVAMRIVDLFSPIGKGQRGMIVSPPKAGKTTLLKDVAHSILQNDPQMRLLILLIDERPEEVTDIREAIQGENVEVIYSTFDELPEHHKRVSEMVIERAKRLVEQKENVTILLDSITRLARAYNLTVPPSGRTLSGGLDPAALHMPKRFFGAARNMREGGSLTILATALVDTGSKMDDVVYEEFKGTGNMELVLDRKLSEKRLFPAIDIPKSGTRREDLLLDREEQEAVYIMRRALNGMKSDEAVENILNMFVHTKDNRELVARVRRQKYI